MIDVEFDGITLRPPGKEDGAALHDLVRVNPPLDMNSVYCYVLLCTHFSDTCIVAEKDGELIGFVTGYIKPGEPDVYFLWQVGVGREGRGRGLALKMIQAILARKSCRGIRELQTTVTRSNRPSRNLFARLAREENAEITEQEDFFSRENLAGHAAECLFRIAPLSTPKK
jgi:L-2,4-diaminobutyric acid acetyltransferase